MVCSIVTHMDTVMVIIFQGFNLGVRDSAVSAWTKPCIFYFLSVDE